MTVGSDGIREAIFSSLCISPKFLVVHTGMQEGGVRADGAVFGTKSGGCGRGCPLIKRFLTGPATFLQFLYLLSYCGMGSNEKVHLSRTFGSPL